MIVATVWAKEKDFRLVSEASWLMFLKLLLRRYQVYFY